MSTFVIQPYVGAGKINFGASKNTVISLLGMPIQCSTNRRKEEKMTYDDLELVFLPDAAGVCELTFRPDSHPVILGIDIFHDRDALQKLALHDAPLEYVGILFFPTLGITASGLHNEDSRSVTAIAPGRLDGIKKNFLPYKLDSSQTP